MSLTAVKPYFKSRCSAVGLSLHPEPFDTNDIPSSILDKSFQVGFTDGSGTKLNQNDQEIDIPVRVIFYVKGYRNIDDGQDRAIEKLEQLIKEIEKPENRLGGLLKNVVLSGFLIEPISNDNDNAIRTILNFTVKTILAL